MKIRGISFIWIVSSMVAVSTALSAADGVLIVAKETSVRGNVSTTTEIRIEKSRIRVNTTSLGTHIGDLMFDAQQRRILFVTNITKTYSELSESDADQYRKEWRELGRAPMPGVNTEYRQTGTDTVGMWTCTRYDRYENTRKLEELCVIDPKQLGLAAADFDVVRQYAEFYPDYPPKFSGLFRITKQDGSVFDAFPVRRVAGTGDGQLVWEIMDVKRQMLGDAILEVPDGFKRVSVVMPKMLGGIGPPPGAGTGTGVYQPGSGITNPIPISQPSPSYTADAMRAKVQGVAVVGCIVEVDGRPSNCHIVRSLDEIFGLDLEAMKAAQNWRFRPGMAKGEPVRVAITIEMSFTLKSDPTPQATRSTTDCSLPASIAPEAWNFMSADAQAAACRASRGAVNPNRQAPQPAPSTPLAQNPIDIQALIKDTQRLSTIPGEMTVVWWIPDQFWQAAFAQNQAMSLDQREKFMAIVRPYIVIAVADGRIGPLGGVTWNDEQTVRAGMTIKDSAGASYSPLDASTINADVKNLVQIAKPIFANSIGAMGQNMWFVLFPSKARDGHLITNPTSQGSLTVSLAGREFRYSLPLTSLLPPMYDPTSGERFPGTYNYNPITGTNLVSTKPTPGGIVGLLTAPPLSSSTSAGDARVPSQTPSIEGLAPDQVRAILGSPTSIDNSGKWVIWYYSRPEDSVKIFWVSGKATLRQP